MVLYKKGELVLLNFRGECPCFGENLAAYHRLYPAAVKCEERKHKLKVGWISALGDYVSIRCTSCIADLGWAACPKCTKRIHKIDGRKMRWVQKKLRVLEI